MIDTPDTPADPEQQPDQAAEQIDRAEAETIPEAPAPSVDPDAATSPNIQSTPDFRPDTRTLKFLLHQDVSLRSIRDLLNYEIIPSKRSVNPEEQIAYLGDSEGDAQVLNESMGKLMKERGMINDEQLAKAREHQERTGQPFLRTLLQTEIAMPQQIDELLHMRIPFPIGKMPADAFTNWLIESKAASREQLAAAWEDARAAKTDFITHLRTSELVNDTQLAQAMAAESEMPFEEVTGVESISQDILSAVPTTLLIKRKALPLRMEDDELVVAFADAVDVHELDKMELTLDHRVRSVLVPRDQLMALLDRVLDSAVDLPPEQVTDTSAARILDLILRGLIRCRGTDVHFEPQRSSTRVRYRVDGRLHDMMTLDPPTARRLAARVMTLADMNVTEKHRPQDGHLTYKLDDTDCDVRIASVPCNHGQKLALRRVQAHMAHCSLEQLGMGKSQRQAMDAVMSEPNGLILVSGPVGAGKTTTLYSCLSCLDCLANNIMTIEDPIEYELPGGAQIQVNERLELTFASGLRAILRQDPDVILVGEIRDEETAQVAVRAAMTGQLVFSTLHANSAATAVTSLLNLDVPPYLVSQAVTGVVFQELLRKVCPECQYDVELTEFMRRELGLAADDRRKLSRGRGCKHCLQTGYSGRVGAYEILHVDEAFRDVIIRQPTSHELNDAAEKAGILSLRAHATQLVLNGVTTFDEMQRVL